MFSSVTIQIEDTEALTKVDIRQKVWKHFQENDLANFPLSVFRRIPNFKGADEAGAKLAELACFKDAKSVKVNLDKPQGEVRFLTLQAGKFLLVPTPGLRSGLFNLMENTSAGDNTPENLRLLAQNDGMKRFSKSLELDDVAKVDLVVVGSVAVSKSGHRVGKGEGFVDLEYGMMRHMKCVDENTLIVTTVHDCQVFDQLPARLFGSHDVPVDVIVTPTQVIFIDKPHQRPAGIIWKLINAEKFYRVAILLKLWQRQKAAGEDVSLASDDPVPTEEKITEYWKKVEAEREAGREARAASRQQRAGGRGGRGGRRGGFKRGGRGGRGGAGEGAPDGQLDEDGNRILVTVNVNKRNRIVRRSVRASTGTQDAGDEASGDAPNGDVAPTRGRGRGRGRERRTRGFMGGPPPFSIFLGNVPPHSRTREIKEAVKEVIDEKAQGVDIQRRTQAGYAFLRFSRLGPEHADELVAALQGLRVLDQEVVVEKAKERGAREEMEGESGEGREGGYEGGRGYRGSRGGRRGGGKRYRGGRRGGRGGEGGSGSGGGEEGGEPEFRGEERRRRIEDDEDGGSAGEEWEGGESNEQGNADW